MRALSSFDRLIWDWGLNRFCDEEYFFEHYFIKHCKVEAPSLQENLDREIELGEKLISHLPAEFKSKNRGKFIAITYDNKILAVCDSLAILNEELCRIDPHQNYYIARIGYDSIARI